jgi:DNA-binding CsgD family transcriptional regulator
VSARELDCLKWTAAGKTALEASIILGISERTVRFHLNAAREKLGCVTTTQAVAKAIVNQLIDVWAILKRSHREGRLATTRLSGMVTVKVENGYVEQISRGREQMECVIDICGSAGGRRIQNKVAITRQVQFGCIRCRDFIWHRIAQDPDDRALIPRGITLSAWWRDRGIIMTRWGDLIGVCHINVCHKALWYVHGNAGIGKLFRFGP